MPDEKYVYMFPETVSFEKLYEEISNGTPQYCCSKRNNKIRISLFGAWIVYPISFGEKPEGIVYFNDIDETSERLIKRIEKLIKKP
jgi:hypothetical protein